MPNLYRKTAKGLSEIETRAHKLPPRARSALILVDGKRDAEALRALVGAQFDETLALLLDQGFIALVEKPASAPAVDIPITPAPAAKPAAPAPDKAPSADFQAARRAAVRELNVILGPNAEALAIRMEKARDAAELRPILVLAAQVIANARGKAAAEDYANRFLTE